MSDRPFPVKANDIPPQSHHCPVLPESGHRWEEFDTTTGPILQIRIEGPGGGPRPGFHTEIPAPMLSPALASLPPLCHLASPELVSVVVQSPQGGEVPSHPGSMPGFPWSLPSPPFTTFTVTPVNPKFPSAVAITTARGQVGKQTSFPCDLPVEPGRAPEP